MSEMGHLVKESVVLLVTINKVSSQCTYYLHGKYLPDYTVPYLRRLQFEGSKFFGQYYWLHSQTELEFAFYASVFAETVFSEWYSETRTLINLAQMQPRPRTCWLLSLYLWLSTVAGGINFTVFLGTVFVVACKTRISVYNDTLVHAMKVCGWRGSIVPHILTTRIYVRKQHTISVCLVNVKNPGTLLLGPCAR
jgi:hypothetical protein